MSKSSDSGDVVLASDDNTVDLVPVEFVAQYFALPLRVDETTLHVAVAFPECLESLDAVREATGYSDLVVQTAPESAFEAWLQENHGCLSALEAALAADEDVAIEGDKAKQDSGQQILHYLIALCHRRGASRVFVESMSGRARVRMRMGESLETVLLFNHEIHGQIAARMAKLLQDSPSGTLAVRVSEQAFHLHFSVVVTAQGSTLSFKLKHPEPALLEDLDFSVLQIEILEECLAQPSGLIVLSGCHASGLTTTAMALATRLLSVGRKSYLLTQDLCLPHSQLNQVAIRADVPIELQLRSVIKHEPDVLIMDLPGSTAAFKAAVHAAMSGCLVVLCCDYPRAVDALSSDVVSNYSMASTALCVVAQQLFRKVCDGCAQGYEPAEAVLRELGIPKPALARAKFRRGKGCAACGGSGFDGVVVKREMLHMDEDLRLLVRDGAPAESLLEHLRGQGFYTLWETAILALIKGETTVEEVRASLG
ncbi:MAG TPA: hypothetical protein EYN06_05565 [Myxococcales bacterium]|nr:hypothetical protein [Myxococcales bacterium]HIN85931.1 hypothetical protein [Myxococcales bacterium]